MIIPTPEDSVYLGFIFAILFCILNAFQSVFIFIWSVIMKNIELKRISTALVFNKDNGKNNDEELDSSKIEIEYRYRRCSSNIRFHE